MSGTETLGGPQPIKNLVNSNEASLNHAFINDNGAALVEGQEVYLKADGTVAMTDGTQVAIGTIFKGGEDGESVTVTTRFIAMIQGVAKVAGNAARMMKQNGVVTSEGVPELVAAVSTNYSTTMQLFVTAGADELVKCGVLYHPVVLA